MDKFLRLKIKTKLTFGIGLLFTMIVLLGGLAVQNITDMSSDTHRFQQSHPYSLTADDGLVAMHTGADGVPCMSVSCVSHGGMESRISRLPQSCKQHGVADGLRQ